MKEVKKSAILQKFKVVGELAPKRVEVVEYNIHHKPVRSKFVTEFNYIVSDGCDKYILPSRTNGLKQGDYIEVMYLNGNYHIRRLKS